MSWLAIGQLPRALSRSLAPPWRKTRILTDQEVGELRQNRAISLGELQPPEWPLPTGFATELPIRGFHLGRFAFLLRSTNHGLTAVASLPGTM